MNDEDISVPRPELLEEWDLGDFRAEAKKLLSYFEEHEQSPSIRAAVRLLHTYDAKLEQADVVLRTLQADSSPLKSKVRDLQLELAEARLDIMRYRAAIRSLVADGTGEE